MSFEFQNISPDTLGDSYLGLITSFHRYHRQNNGLIDDEFSRFFPFLTLCASTECLAVSPPILSVGSKADQRLFYGNVWAENILEEQVTPDDGLEELAAEGYQIAAEEGVSCQDCFSMIDVGEGVLKPCSYIRHISKVKTAAGAEFFILAAKILNLDLQ